MASMKYILASLAVMLSMASCTPVPGGFGRRSEHFIIHVPYKVHTIHHHHVSKVPVPVAVPVVEKVPVPIVQSVPVPVVQKVLVYGGASSGGYGGGYAYGGGYGGGHYEHESHDW